MNIIRVTGNDALARVFVTELADRSMIECVESVQRPVRREEKWVLILSTLKGCPAGCPMCDAGGAYKGKLTKEEILSQVELLISQRYPEGLPPMKRLKIQFARMGEPALNDAVLDVLTALPTRLPGVPVQPSISTVAPAGREAFFSRLREIKRRHYPNGWFQMQFSVHTTDDRARRALIPIRTWSLREMASFGKRFFEPGDRKVALNFAPAKGFPLDPESLVPLFSRERFIVKLTPINPTASAKRHGLRGLIDPEAPDACQRIVESFRDLGFETILNIGDLEENQIGSNCGMYVGAVERRDQVAGAE
jgi:23S rRNA (adenine2503-C2)-methyltransferase